MPVSLSVSLYVYPYVSVRVVVGGCVLIASSGCVSPCLVLLVACWWFLLFLCVCVFSVSVCMSFLAPSVYV